MSKLIDRLNRVTHSAPQPIGFRASQAAPAPVMQLVARLTGAGDPSAKRLSGADAALAPVTAITSGTAKLKAGSAGNLEKTAKLGADFVLFPAVGTPASIPPEDGAGVILEIESSTSDTVLRTVNDAPVDAILVSDEERGEGPLTWAEMLRLQRVAKIVSLPLLVAVPAATAVGELRVLSEAGVAGVVVGLDDEEADDLLANLRKTIDGLPTPARKRSRGDAVIPQVGRETAAAADDEPDEDGEEFD